eukprot:8619567-Pyramimonas_sp.AAC.1
MLSSVQPSILSRFKLSSAARVGRRIQSVQDSSTSAGGISHGVEEGEGGVIIVAGVGLGFAAAR